MDEDITLMPADTYLVINKTILTEVDRKNIISLYEPIIGSSAVSLYFTLWRDLNTNELISRDFNHHHLIGMLKLSLFEIKEAREGLEAVGLLKTYVQNGEVNNYLYELYSPLVAEEFFTHPVLNIILFNNIGKVEYEALKNEYEKIKFNLTGYQDISKTLDMTFSSAPRISIDAKQRTSLPLSLTKQVDFDFMLSSLPKGIVNAKTFNKKTRDLINLLAFIYNFDSFKMSELIRQVLDENGFINKESLRLNARKLYQYDNGVLPTLVYRSHPDYLKSNLVGTSNKEKIIYVFENTSPYDFLKNKYKGVSPTSRDLKVIESLLLDLELKPAVVNVLIDYSLRINNNKLVSAFLETIAGQWKRLGIESAEDAMRIAENEHKKSVQKDRSGKELRKKNEPVPVWFNEVQEKEEISALDKEELETLLKEFK